MSVATPEKEYPHIIINPDVSGGQPVIEGSRIPVITLIRAHQLGMDFDEILVQYPDLRPEQLHVAFAYYLDHQAELDSILEQGDTPIAGATEVKV